MASRKNLGEIILFILQMWKEKDLKVNLSQEAHQTLQEYLLDTYNKLVSQSQRNSTAQILFECLETIQQICHQFRCQAKNLERQGDIVHWIQNRPRNEINYSQVICFSYKKDSS